MIRNPHKLGILLVFLALVLVPLLYYGLDSELAKWKAAQAELQHRSGDTATAIATMEAAIQQSPRDQWIKLGLTKILSDDGQVEEALKLTEEVLDVDPQSAEALSRKSEYLMHLGRSEEALEVLKQYYESLGRKADPVTKLNHLAYFRALAKQDLDRAKAEIDEVIKETSIALWPNGLPMSLYDQTLLAAAVVALNVGNQESVIELLDKRIEVFESNSMYAGLFLEDFFTKLLAQEPTSEKLKRDAQINDRIAAADKSFLAYLYAVRALLHQARGNNKLRDADRVGIAELDLDEMKILLGLPSDWDALIRMNIGVQFLDTRAMVNLARRKELFVASRDLNLAVLGYQLTLDSFDGDLQNTIQNEDGRSFKVSDVRRILAVILKHRSQLSAVMGRSKQAEEDRQRIEKLGFKDSDRLF